MNGDFILFSINISLKMAIFVQTYPWTDIKEK